MREIKKMENLDDVLPYLKLGDGEEILFAKRFEGFSLQIKCLAKYHEPEKFPEHLITTKKDWYIFDQIDIITNFRLIKFGINYNYTEEDRVTPISDIFHHENLFLWVNLEDIIDYKVDYSVGNKGAMGFKFFGKGKLKVKERPLNFTGYNYEEYCQLKDIVIKLLKFEPQEIDKEEDKKIRNILNINKIISNVMFLGLCFLGWIIIPSTFPKFSQNPTVSFFQYSFFGLYVVCWVFDFLLITISYLILLKKYGENKYATFKKINYVWYIGPSISVYFFFLMVMILVSELLLLNFIDNGFLALSIAIGFWTITTILAVYFIFTPGKRKKERKKPLIRKFKQYKIYLQKMK